MMLYEGEEANYFDGSHRVEVDLAHMVQLVPVRVGLVHHRALQLHLVGGNGSTLSSPSSR